MQENTYIEPGIQQTPGNMDTKTAGQLVRSIRKAKGLTQQQLSDNSKISLRNLIRLEHGENVSLGAYLNVMESLGYTLIPEKIDDSGKK